MPRPKDVVKQFTPEHISEQIPKDLGELKEEVEQAIEPKPAEIKKDPTESLKSKREYPFQFDWTSPAGKNYSGEFVNRILTIGNKQGVGLMRAQLAAGMAFAALDPTTIEINFIISHMTFSLVKRPDWAKDFTQLTELELLQEIYEEVASHEAIFLGYGEDQKDS